MVEGFCSVGVHGLLVTGLADSVAAEAMALCAKSGLAVGALLGDPSSEAVARCADAGAVAVGPVPDAPVVEAAGCAAIAVWPHGDGPSTAPFVDGVSMAGFGADGSPASTARLRSLADRAL